VKSRIKCDRVAVTGIPSDARWSDRVLIKVTKQNKAVPLLAMQALRGRGIYLLGIRWRWMVSVTPRPRFTSWERASGTHSTGGWVGLRAGLGTQARGEILYLCREPKPGRPVCRQDTIYADWATPAPRWTVQPIRRYYVRRLRRT
jgi:hypothetical protein